jgi:energy-converting hydrogenase Eha subunit B
VPEPGTLAGSVIAAITLWGVKHRRSRKRVG